MPSDKEILDGARQLALYALNAGSAVTNLRFTRDGGEMPLSIYIAIGQTPIAAMDAAVSALESSEIVSSVGHREIGPANKPQSDPAS